MSTATAAAGGPARPAPTRRVTAAATARHVATLAWRNLVQIKHNPMELLDLSIQPIMFVLLFAYVFGPPMAGSVEAYLPIVIPGIIAQNALFAGMTTGYGLNVDITKGVYDRFRSLPISRSAPWSAGSSPTPSSRRGRCWCCCWSGSPSGSGSGPVRSAWSPRSG
ncbi:ABC transporter permease [Actinomadura keratinilytica]|uniref:ABC transporter permease n=1 Tax=Actinomadura keratinilytica TaxID=547461 RepID=UPI0036212BF3